MQVRKLLMISALSLMLLPASAQAQSWFFSPFIGGNFGGSADFGDFPDADDEVERRIDFGATLGWNPSVVGFEIDLGYSPNFFADTAGDRNFEFGDSNVTTLNGQPAAQRPAGQRRSSLRFGRSRPDPGQCDERHGALQRSVDERSRRQHRWRPQRAVQRQGRHSRRPALLPLAAGQPNRTTISICRSAVSISGAAPSASRSAGSIVLALL